MNESRKKCKKCNVRLAIPGSNFCSTCQPYRTSKQVIMKRAASKKVATYKENAAKKKPTPKKNAAKKKTTPKK